MLDLPRTLAGYGRLRSPDTTETLSRRLTRRNKILPDLDAALSACELKDGDTISFHHHLRNGDGVLNAVMEAVARRGLRGIHVAATSIFPVHAPLVEHIRNGTVRRISANFISGPVGEAVSAGALEEPVILRTHGGRARALDQGELKVDVAFVAAPAADELGNISGRIGRAACGTMGYPLCDVEVAARVVAVTDSLMPFPCGPVDIAQDKVDHVVVVGSIGDPGGISSGTTRPAEDQLGLAIGETAAAVIAASGFLEDGFAFQTGAGSISLATAAAVGREMARRGITGSFAAGGITGFHVDMLEAGLFRNLMDVQCFDQAAVRSYRDDARHLSMSAGVYAAPHIGGAVVDRIDTVVLGAAEVDLNFNVNVTTKAGGVIIGGSGGHADTAAGARMSVITTRLNAAGYAKIVPQVGTLTTPGATVDVVVTDGGIAVNPARGDLCERFRAAGLPVLSIEELGARAADAATRAVPARADGRVVAVSEYRDGSVTDVVRQIDPERL
ncbi:citrate lyase subunit alpha [Ruegeria marina]|uniref:Citrate lyase alpha chain n=1 Tax=Ruegeria marina TaxID=639004 RepID=A0A1G6TE97_9RHOB|nr:citrate lyase subunit alpha [Ruegeria marina]SDD26836.1 citrate lyase subunit alpha / citrate CoA-transferase [Ruegeria marina]